MGGTSYISNQFSFDTINSNNSLIFAGSGSDTLSFVAGNNVTITTNTTTKTITINSVSGDDVASAFDKANAAYASQNITATFANSSYIHANAAFDKANSSATLLDVNAEIIAFTIAFSW